MKIRLNTAETAGEIYPLWTVMNCNRPQKFQEPEWIQFQKDIKPFITQVNAVYLLGGRRPGINAWYKGVNDDGSIDADFTGMIAQLQAMLDNGYKPWPVLDNVPYGMSDPPTEHAFGNTAPPADEAVWEKYVEAALQAMVDAFGREEVDTWWFRVGTEPDYIPGHWSGTKEQFLEHYERTVAAFERVVPTAKIGPGNIINPVDGEYGVETFHQWGLDFFNHCDANSIRMDWFSLSWYGRVGITLDYFDEAIRMIKERAAQFDRFKDIPLLIGEFSILHDEIDRRIYVWDVTEWGVSFYAAVVRRAYDYGLKEIYEWGHTALGVYHPRAHLLSWLTEMVGGERLVPELSDRTDLDTGVIACKKGEDIYLVLYNHHAHREPKTPETMTVTIEDKRFHPSLHWEVTEKLIDKNHGIWSYAFNDDAAAAGVQLLKDAAEHEGQPVMRFGKPGVEVFNKNRDKYDQLGQPHIVCTDKPVTCAQGSMVIERHMDGHSVRFIRLSPRKQEADPALF